MAQKPEQPRLNFEKLIDKSDQFKAQTVNGTALWKGTGWNRSSEHPMPQLEPFPTWRAGRSNRTGE